MSIYGIRANIDLACFESHRSDCKCLGSLDYHKPYLLFEKLDPWDDELPIMYRIVCVSYTNWCSTEGISFEAADGDTEDFNPGMCGETWFVKEIM